MEEYKIGENHLKELINFCGNDAAGKILKRIDIVDDRGELKKVVKELVYEGFRNFKHFLTVYQGSQVDGQQKTVFKFKSRPKG